MGVRHYLRGGGGRETGVGMGGDRALGALGAVSVARAKSDVAVAANIKGAVKLAEKRCLGAAG